MDEEIRKDEAPEKAKKRNEILLNKAESSAVRAEMQAKREQELTRESALEGLMKRNQVIEAQIVGVEDLTMGSETVVCATAFTTQGDSKEKVVIPYEYMYRKNIMDMSTVDTETEAGRLEYIRRQRQMLTKMLGLKVPVCIKNITEDPRDSLATLIVASRADAAKIIRRAAFTGVRPMEEDKQYSATVISVNPHGVGLTFCGVDSAVPQSMLTERYLLDLRQYYHVGDKVKFVLRELKIDGDDVSFRMDTRTPELEEMKERQRLISAGTTARGVISRIYEKNGSFKMYAWLPDWELAAKIAYVDADSFGREPRAGDEVLLVVDGFRQSGYLEARIRTLHGNTGLFNHF